MNDQSELNVTLYFTEGASDKEYRISLVPQAEGWVCNYANGRRGKPLQHGTKTNTPLPYENALKIYDKTLREKLAKGYTQANSGQRYAGTSNESRDSGLLPELPTAIDPSLLASLIESDQWIAQEKFDGENRILAVEGPNPTGVNRKGLTVPIREDWTLTNAAGTRSILCGEDMGNRFVAFDMIARDGACLRQLSYTERHRHLVEFTAAAGASWMVVAPYFESPNDKQQLHDDLIERSGEGLVFKLKTAAYFEGRSSSALKHKFQESSSFIVRHVNDQRSVSLGLVNDHSIIEDLGNVTIPANHAMPAVGDVVEIEYMYRFERGGLMQPKYKGSRKDIDAGSCTTSQIQRIKAKMQIAA